MNIKTFIFIAVLAFAAAVLLSGLSHPQQTPDPAKILSGDYH